MAIYRDQMKQEGGISSLFYITQNNYNIISAIDIYL